MLGTTTAEAADESPFVGWFPTEKGLLRPESEFAELAVYASPFACSQEGGGAEEPPAAGSPPLPAVSSRSKGLLSAADESNRPKSLFL